MSTSYQPKIFRYQDGCCICKAKSSSSRFTCSQKYEFGFRICFRLQEKRTGLICNACVLVVKRWSNLKDKFSKNWHHVVDSKYKNIKKIKAKKTEKVKECPTEKPQFPKHKYLRKSRLDDDLSDDQGLGEDISSSSASSIAGEERLGEALASMNSSLAPSPQPHYQCFVENTVDKRKHNRNIIHKIDISKLIRLSEGRSDFLATPYWQEENVCCGRIWVGKEREVAIDGSFRYCEHRNHSSIVQQNSFPTYSKRTEDEGVDMYDEVDSTMNSPQFYGRQISEEHSTGMKILLQFSQAITT